MHRGTVALFVSYRCALARGRDRRRRRQGAPRLRSTRSRTRRPGTPSRCSRAPTTARSLPPGTVATGGLGTGANLGSQGSIIVRRAQAVRRQRRQQHDLVLPRSATTGSSCRTRSPSGGVLPISLTVHDHVLYVLNAGGGGNITGFTVNHDGLAPLAGSTRPLGAGSSGPAQVVVLAERQDARRHGEGVEHDRHVRGRRARHRRRADRQRGRGRHAVRLRLRQARRRADVRRRGLGLVLRRREERLARP